MADLDELTRRFRQQSGDAASRTPFHARVCGAIADDPDLVSLLSAAPEEQQLPVLLLAALHYDVLGQPDCELAAWYPTVATNPRTDDVGPAVHRHGRRRGEQLRSLVASRTTQTNEVGRCALLLPAIGLIASEFGPLALVDVGTSAGLNLQLDRFEYWYEPGGSVGGRSEVRLEVGTRGDVPVPAAIPTIAARLGVDRSPIDTTDEGAMRWLRACVWPDQADRFRRLDAAIRIAREHPVEIRQSDAVSALDDAIDAVGSAGHPVVTNSWVLNYLTPAERAEYVTELDRIGSSRDLSWVFAESPGQAEGLPFHPDVAGSFTTALVLVRWRSGCRTAEHLGLCHPHGYWLHWDRRVIA